MNCSGVLIVDKPRGLTSRQVSERVGRILEERKVGHAGTLDPLATGVLVVCIGRGTLLSGYLTATEKTYRVVALLGVETDTYDTDGRVTARCDTGGIDTCDIESALKGFEGRIEQQPPPFSAVKHKGRPLYHYARRGVEVEPPKRGVHVISIALRGSVVTDEGPCAVIEINCGPGTYARSLVHDLGRKLGCGACVTELRRTRSGRFTEDDAVGLDSLSAPCEDGTVHGMFSLEEATEGMSTLRVTEDGSRCVKFGKPLMEEHVEGGINAACGGSAFRVVDGNGTLLALYCAPTDCEDERVLAKAVRVIRPEAGVSPP